MSSRTIHARLDDDVILSILDVVNDDSKPLSSQFAAFCGLMISELREVEIINTPEGDVSELLDRRLKVLGKTDLAGFRKELRAKIDKAAKDITEPNPEGFDIPDDGSPEVKTAILDVDRLPKLDWPELEANYPLDRFIKDVGEDVVMKVTIRIIYHSIKPDEFGGEKAERLIREMYPRVAEWVQATAVSKQEESDEI